MEMYLHSQYGIIVCCLVMHWQFTVYLYYYYHNHHHHHMYYYGPQYIQFRPYVSILSLDTAVHMAVPETPILLLCICLVPSKEILWASVGFCQRLLRHVIRDLLVPPDMRKIAVILCISCK